MPRTWIVMGVSGSGKSSVGAALARALDAKFLDGDDLHPRANLLKMAAGTPLDDADRAPWLERINDAAFSLALKHEAGVIVCSALKRRYRDAIRRDNPQLAFLFLDGDYATIAARLRARHGHYQKEVMLRSQFEALEPPGDDEPDVLRIVIDGTPDQVLARALAAVRGYAAAMPGQG
ncbi:gluconokinase [Chitiniphilus shinanonensis]|uniref:Gluconokinase n=1 Tax=Chitiniphilus shinanonensis TaxID=553088 RepID=A0ABQ6BTH1_9NEIS|nr:gluconokinase [Chitiniphilus shinanonensis]GLS05310.1 gluconokinase [Chitiniphilus shinanonensis]